MSPSRVNMDKALLSRGQRTRTLAVLFLAVGTAKLGLGIIAPILPLYAKSFSAGPLELGLVFAGFSIPRALLGPSFGRWSDRIGRKRLILAGLVIYSLASLLYAVSQSLWQIGAVRFLQGFAAIMVEPLAQAYAGDLTSPGKEGRVMNAMYTAQFAGMAAGPLLGGIAGRAYSYDVAFLIMGALGMTALFLVLMFVPGDRVRRKDRDIHRVRSSILDIARQDFVKATIAYFVTRGFWREGFTSFFPIYAATRLGWDAAVIGIVLTSYALVEGIVQIPFGYLADRYPRVPQIICGSVLAPFPLFLVPLAGAVWQVVLLAALMGVFSSLGRASLVALRTSLGRTHGMGMLAGFQHSSFSIGQSLGPLASGAVARMLDTVAVFPFGALVGCVGTGLVVLYMRKAGQETGSGT